MQKFVFLILLSLLAPLQAERPNIVYFMADDLGIGDVKIYGGDRCKTETPNFDALAAAGMRFTDAHPVASVCVPSRVAIMTGRYPWRFGAPVHGGPWGFLGPRFGPETPTLGHMLRKAGYATGYVGKWHLGTEMATKDGKVQGPENVDYGKPLKLGPVQYGFDYSFIMPGSLDMFPYAYAKNNVWQGSVTAQKGWSAFNRVGPAEKDFEDVDVLDTFSGEAEAFIAWQAEESKSGKPFFLFVALTSPHTPTSPSEKFQGKSKLGLYGDFVMETDDCLGRVVAALEKHGLRDNTLLVATSDHGPASYAGNEAKATFAQFKEMETLGHFSRGIYRGFKFSIYEGGLRVPFIISWPAAVEAGSTSDAIVGLQDVYATFAEVAGQQLLEGEGPDSISLLPVLRDVDAEPTRKNMVMEAGGFAIRDGDWKLCVCPGSGAKGMWGNTPPRDEAWKAARAAFGKKPKRTELGKTPFVQLFNLAEDPGESTNLAAANSERVKSMLKLLASDVAAHPNEREINIHRNAPKFVFDD
ncbi:MAG: arylsulfatase A [Verrucomicrobiales bacterium]|jgi:arylsulfatase A